MKKLFTLLLAFVALVQAFGQNDNGFVTVGKIDSLHSNILNEERKIWVYVPDQNLLYSQAHYPVVYLLDGDAHFRSVAGLVEQLSEMNGNTLLPKMIVVGIPNTDRTRDLTPTHSLKLPDGSEVAFMASSGGGENFTTFLEKELIPYVDAHYPTTTYRVLIGHSFGGLFALNTFFNHSNLFGAYIAIDPSLWWDNENLFHAMTQNWKTAKLENKRLFLGVANTMPHGMDYTKVEHDTASATRHIRDILAFAKFAEANPRSLSFAWKYYPDDDHGSVPLITEYDGLRFLFSFYKLPSNDPDEFTPQQIVDHYKKVSTVLGYSVAPPEQLVNEAGYHFLQKNKYDIAYTYFKMNLENYPGSSNGYDSMGDYYAQHQENQKAMEMFTKALTLKDAPQTREKLEKLKGNNKTQHPN